VDEFGGGGGSKEKNNNGGGGGRVGGYVDTSKADAPVWLMKCPPVVAQSLRGPSSSDSSLPVAKVVLSFDPLKDSHPEVRILIFMHARDYSCIVTFMIHHLFPFNIKSVFHNVSYHMKIVLFLGLRIMSASVAPLVAA